MRIRTAQPQDLPCIMEIYAHARQFMADHGNPDQWGPTCWPPEELIRDDIKKGDSYVCIDDADEIVGVFYYVCGKDIDPCYADITDGRWFDDSTYGVVHRIASSGKVKGVGAFCLNWAYEKSGHLRIDTYGDNIVLQNLLKKLGFIHCGTIYVAVDDLPRMAFEKSARIYEKEAKERWGGTKAFEEYQTRMEKEGTIDLSKQMNAIFADFSRLKDSKIPFDDPSALSKVRDLQKLITVRCYTCTKEILSSLSEMYVGDPRFKATIDRYGEGTAEYVSACIKAYCSREG